MAPRFVGAATTTVTFHRSVLPWELAPEDAERFRRILIAVLLLCLLLALTVPWVPPPQRPSAAQPLPQELTRLILEAQPEPPKPPPPKPEAPKPDKPQDSAPTDPAQPKPTDGAPLPATEARNPATQGAPGDAIAAARRKVSGVGLLAMKDELAALRSSGAPVAEQLRPAPANGPGVGTGSGAGVGAGAGADPGLPARDVITANASGGSGGIATSNASRDTGGGGLAGRSTTLVAGVAGGGGGGGPGGAALGGGSGAGPGGKGGSGAGSGAGGSGAGKAPAGRSSRSLEDVKLVFERNKGAIHAIYNRALREDPTLQGKVVVELKIAPSGQVTELKLVSSELHAPELEQKLLARIRQFDFGAREVEPLVVTWPLDFLPG